MDTVEALKEIHDKLADAGTAEEIGAAFHATGKRFGFITCLIVDVTKVFDSVGPAIIFAARGRKPIEVLEAGRRLTQHPLAVRARASDEPFITSQVRKELKIGEEWWCYFPPQWKGYDGMVVPIHDRGALAWYVGFAGPEPDLSPRVRSVMTTTAYAAYDRFRALLDAKKPDSPLSHREAQCLRLVAQGKTDNEVGRILEISPRTVRFHIGNAKTKLGVATRIQAATKRISEG